jgi:hypothetical protein
LRLTKRTQNTINWTAETCRTEDIKQHYQAFRKIWVEFEAGRLNYSNLQYDQGTYNN